MTRFNDLNASLVVLLLLSIFVFVFPSIKKSIEMQDEVNEMIVRSAGSLADVSRKLVDVKQLKCLATNIFYEAGNETVQGQAAVARVVMNRIKYGFGRTPCDVVYQSTTVERTVDEKTKWVKLCQFSWVCEGKSPPNQNSAKYKASEKIAYEVLVENKHKDVVPNNTLFFHNLTVDPMWPYRQVAKIGNHIFYSKTKKDKDQNN
jgi:spore germination cell wall hydrolase CwlJ-like protein